MKDYRILARIFSLILLMEPNLTESSIQDLYQDHSDLHYLSRISCALRNLHRYFSNENYLVILYEIYDSSAELLFRSLHNEVKLPHLIQGVSLEYNSREYQTNFRKDNTFVKATTVLMLTHDKETIEYLLELATKCVYWNSRIKLIILVVGYLSKGGLRHMLEYCWKKHVLNVVIVYINDFEEDSRNYVVVMMYNPFSGVFVNHIVCQCKWYICDVNNQPLNLFPDKLQNIYGYVLKACGYVLEPYLIIQNTTNGTKLEGLDWMFHESFSKHLNFTYEVSLEHSTVGLKLDNGSWTEAFGDVVSGKVDIILDRVRVTPERLDAMEISGITIISRLNFMVPKAGFVPKWIALVLPFPIYIWVLIVLLLFAIYLVWRIFVKVYSYRESLSTTNISLYILSLVLKVSTTQKPLHFSFRLLYIVCVLCLLILTSVYEGLLFGYLTGDTHYPDINTLKELAESDLEIQSFIFHRDLFMSSANPYITKMMPRLRLTNNMQSMLDSVGVQGTSACLYHYTILEYNANLKYTDSSEETSVHIIDETLVAYSAGYTLPRASPYSFKVQQHATRIVESGLDIQWRVLLNRQVMLNKIGLNVPVHKEQVALSILNTRSMFILWVIGIQVSFGCFVAEKAWIRYKKRC